ncbi:MAG: hypothetical protein EOO40_08210, partial [Deltaproteobacteria bacterium]
MTSTHRTLGANVAQAPLLGRALQLAQATFFEETTPEGEPESPATVQPDVVACLQPLKTGITTVAGLVGGYAVATSTREAWEGCMQGALCGSGVACRARRR